MEERLASPPLTEPPSGGLWTRYRLLLAVSLTVAFLDQASKAWIRRHLAFGAVWAPWPQPWRNWLRLVHWKNSGAAFGLGQNLNDVLLIVAVVVIGLVIWYFRQAAHEARCLRWGLALQVGGALGNLWDRALHGTVTDFLAVGDFPVFNLADVAISLGVLCLLWSTWHDAPQKHAPELPDTTMTVPAAPPVPQEEQAPPQPTPQPTPSLSPEEPS